MRTIKFRGKRIDKGIWVYGGFTLDAADMPRITVKTSDETGLEFPKVIPETVGQFTERHDENGKEIYEKDILSFEGRKYIVKWHGEFGRFAALDMKHDEKDFVQLGVKMWDETEVIGNIHDNPELLNI